VPDFPARREIIRGSLQLSTHYALGVVRGTTKTKLMLIKFLLIFSQGRQWEADDDEKSALMNGLYPDGAILALHLSTAAVARGLSSSLYIYIYMDICIYIYMCVCVYT